MSLTTAWDFSDSENICATTAGGLLLVLIHRPDTDGLEAMRDEECLLKRQPDCEEVDLDALVEALADAPDYQPHMYGPAARTLFKEVSQLPFKVSDYVWFFLTSSCY